MNIRWRGARWGLGLLISIAALTAAAPDARLADASQNQDIATLRALLAQHLDVNVPEPDGMTALLWAAHNDDLDTAKLLIQAGANVKAVNRYGVSALTEAATLGDARLIELLLQAGADANTSLPEGDTALMLASRTGSVPAMKVLLDHGAKVDAKDNWHGETALIWAAGENHPAAIRLLIEHGADMNAQTTHLIWPEMKKDPAQVMSKYPAGGLTPLMEAARQNSYEAAEALLQAGANPNLRDPNKLSAMLIAVTNIHWDLANLLLEHGADANDGSLEEAVEVRNSEILRPGNRRPDSIGALDMINALLAHGAKPDSILPGAIPDKKALGGGSPVAVDATPLFRAAKAADLVVMRLLLDKGADAAHVLKDGSTPLMAATGIAPKIFMADEEKREPTDDERLQAVQLCLDHGADVNAVESADAGGSTALHIAAGKGSDRIVQLLLEHGAKTDIKDKQGRTALDVANGVTHGPAMGPPPAVHETTVALIRKYMPAAAEEHETAPR
ncbi:MAG TPA: ankyrin repeat domain-containing protein [Bryobacteraceae bacterium]|nr:ankyrin repeat domain-containing protein [Bryobacteraceae bacterium]